MPDADLLRLQELPTDVIGGKSGDKRTFRVEFIGKAPNEQFPYTVANEVVSAFLAGVLGFNVPFVMPYLVDGDQIALVLWMSPAAREQQGPPVTSKDLRAFVEEHEEEIHGAIVLDLFLANTDRGFSPRRNIAVDETSNRLLLFDFGNALFYRNRERLGIAAGVPRLRAVEQDLRVMFDKVTPAEDRYFRFLSKWDLVEKWCDRIRQVPRFVLENAVKRIPPTICPPSEIERQELMDFLHRRPTYLLDQMCRNPDLFPGLPARGTP